MNIEKPDAGAQSAGARNTIPGTECRKHERAHKSRFETKFAGAALWLCLISCAAGAAPSVFIEDLAWPEVRDAIAAGATTAIYYAGSTEQNGPHMATGKHNFIARHVAGKIAERLGNALVYPIMPFAPTGDALKRTEHMRFPGSVSVSEGTYSAVARDVARSARAAGFRHILLMGDHGGGQRALEQAAVDLDRLWAPGGIRVHYIGDVYYGSEQRAREYLAPRSMSVGRHAGVLDTAELMFVDSGGKWVRRDKLAPGDDNSGVDGDPRQASTELGRTFIEFKVDSAVTRIRQLVPAGKR
ncbi:MAG: creatininase family protein [Betaproteobacteria bacterium]|nr:creatininase family protein [Betaproteobacteria bacterium]